jgi:hypothetical protein
MAPRLEDRFASARAFADALRDADTDVDVPVTRPFPGAVRERPSRSKALLLALATGLVAAALSLSVAGTVTTPETSGDSRSGVPSVTAPHSPSQASAATRSTPPEQAKGSTVSLEHPPHPAVNSPAASVTEPPVVDELRDAPGPMATEDRDRRPRRRIVDSGAADPSRATSARVEKRGTNGAPILR